MVEVFDPIANRWEKCQPMTTARSRVGVAVVNGLLYAIGGYDGQLRLSTVEVYNPEMDSWSKVESMNSKRRYTGSLNVWLWSWRDKSEVVGRLGGDGGCQMRGPCVGQQKNKRGVEEWGDTEAGEVSLTTSGSPVLLLAGKKGQLLSAQQYSIDLRGN